MSISDKQIEDLKAKHGEIFGVEDSEGNLFVFKRPSRADFDRWYDSEKKSQDGRELVQSCLVHPTRDDLISALDKSPGLLQCRNGFVDAAVKAANFTEASATLKKL